jgi:hypothetical protein
MLLDKMVISSSSSGLSVFISAGRRGRGGAINVLCIEGPGSFGSCDWAEGVSTKTVPGLGLMKIGGMSATLGYSEVWVLG